MSPGPHAPRAPETAIRCGPVRRLATICLVLIQATSASAGGLVNVAGSPRAIGRAGTGTVGDDGGGALLVNPAAMARRDVTRAQLGLGFTDDEIAWLGEDAAPIARNQASSTLAPHVALVTSFGAWIVGAAVMTSAVGTRSLRHPGSLPPAQYGDSFDYRYAGFVGEARRDTATLGVARRIGEEVAIGVSLSATRVAVTETRRIWAGFGGRDLIGDPDHDAELRFEGKDWFVPGATAGILYAPAEEPIELAASVAWTQRAQLEGDVTGTGTNPGTQLRFTRPSAMLRLAQPVVVRTGARYLGERFAIELGGDLWITPTSAKRTAWQISGVRVVDESTVDVDLTELASRASLRTHGAVRGAVDVELIGGFLWATGGYAFTTGGTSSSRQSITFGDLGGHTAAVGLEGTAGGVTVTLGWSRTWSVAERRPSDLRLDNPFEAGDREVPIGTYDGSIDQIGVLVDLEWDAPEPL